MTNMTNMTTEEKTYGGFDPEVIMLTGYLSVVKSRDGEKVGTAIKVLLLICGDAESATKFWGSLFALGWVTLRDAEGNEITPSEADPATTTFHITPLFQTDPLAMLAAGEALNAEKEDAAGDNDL